MPRRLKNPITYVDYIVSDWGQRKKVVIKGVPSDSIENVEVLQPLYSKTLYPEYGKDNDGNYCIFHDPMKHEGKHDSRYLVYGFGKTYKEANDNYFEHPFWQEILEEDNC